MTRWSDMDTVMHPPCCALTHMLTISQDRERLPGGFRPIGYDADTQTYSYSGPDGRTYESEPGNRYGELWPIGVPRPPRDPAEIEEMKRNNREALRMMLPFALFLLVFMFMLFKLINRGGGDMKDGSPQVRECAEGYEHIQVHKGDTCWAVAEKYKVDVEELLGFEGNDEVDCDRLRIGQALCVPE